MCCFVRVKKKGISILIQTSITTNYYNSTNKKRRGEEKNKR